MTSPTSSPIPAPTAVAPATPPPTTPSRVAANDDLRREVLATLSGRQELGSAYDEHFAETLVERLNTQIQREVDRQVSQLKARGVRAPRRGLSPEQRLGLAIPSLVFLIPLIAIGGMQGLPGMLIACATVAVVNIAAAFF